MDTILLIIKSTKNRNYSVDTAVLPPLGVMSIATFLSLNGYNVEVLDLSVSVMSPMNIIEKISTLNPIYVGFSAYTENIDETIKLANYIKKTVPTTKLAVGGPHPTLQSDYCIKTKVFDFIFVGEGEVSALETVEAIVSQQKRISYSDINGLIYKEMNKYYNNGVPIPIGDLDLLPIISRQFIKYSNYPMFLTISSSRGCPGRCIYCAAPNMFGSRYRVRNIENVYLETLLSLHDEGWEKEIYYIDDTFTAIPSRLRKYIEIVKQYGCKFTWRCESRADVMIKNPELLDGLAEINCKRLQYGLESGNQDVLDKIGKNIEIAKVEKLVEETCNKEIKVATSLIFGHYCDTLDTMQETLNLVKRLYDKNQDNVEIYLSCNTPFPGTYQYENLEKLGMCLAVNKYSELDMVTPVVETNNFTVNDQRDFLTQGATYMQVR